jgi:hypothetical protein
MGNAFLSGVLAGRSAPWRPAVCELACHGYASMLIAAGLDVVFVSRQLGHAKPDVSLRVYAHLFSQREHADRARVALAGGYAALTAISCG